MTIVVGGDGKKSGKTTVLCQIVASTTHASWTAIKLTPEAHGVDLITPIIQEEHTAGSHCDTARYLAAGARRAYWIRAHSEMMGQALGECGATGAGNLIIESNSVLDVLSPDLFVFVARDAASDHKESALRHVARADAVVLREAPASLLRRVSEQLADNLR